jgi:prepilin-type N-terminal cleavage/methylation domain-containing protein
VSRAPGRVAGRCLDRIRRVSGGDRGVTLMEMVVTVTIMSIVMAIFTTGVLQVFRATNQVERISVAQSQLTIALTKLDREIRYSTGISEPTLYVDGHWYVEYQITFTGEDTCHQLRLNTATRKLEKRTWLRGPMLAPTAWIPLASEVSAPTPVGGATGNRDPFYQPSADSFQRLRLWLFTGPGGSDRSTPAETQIVFTALNTNRESRGQSTDICVEGRGM